MINFDMNINHNFALFNLENKIMIVDSFDNHNFDVRVGTLDHSDHWGEITAESSEELNKKLTEIANKI